MQDGLKKIADTSTNRTPDRCIPGTISHCLLLSLLQLLFIGLNNIKNRRIDYHWRGGKNVMWSSLQFLPGLFLQVTSPLGDVLHHADKVSHGQFAFTTAESGIYLACFWTETLEKGMVVNLNLDWRTGIAAKDWDSIAKKEKLDVSKIVMFLYNTNESLNDKLVIDAEKQTCET